MGRVVLMRPLQRFAVWENVVCGAALVVSLTGLVNVLIALGVALRLAGAACNWVSRPSFEQFALFWFAFVGGCISFFYGYSSSAWLRAYLAGAPSAALICGTIWALLFQFL